MANEALKLGKTARGFPLAEFDDANDVRCSLQLSSSVESKIWLGPNDPNALILPGDNTGWHPYPLPDNVQCTTRMHLTREQVAALLPLLRGFVDTGELTAAPVEEAKPQSGDANCVTNPKHENGAPE